jgi:hypothetical protein
VSQTGFLFIAGQAVPLGSEVEMTFRLPQKFGGRDEEPVFCWAKVVRIEQPSRSARPRVAAQITKRRADPHEVRDIRNVVGEW